MHRRTFVKRLMSGTVLLSAAAFTLAALGHQVRSGFAGSDRRLTILHTNDTHSRIDPFPPGGRYEGMGGTARRARLISEVREQETHVLVLDAGDIFQGTPYFNFFKGEVELKVMSAKGYDVSTLGNHDFDAGIERLAEVTEKYATFPFVNCNYNFSDTPMEGMTKEYVVIEKGDLRIGITGVGIELEGLVPDSWFGRTGYCCPTEKVNRIATHLKEEKGCHCVILLSHLGYSYRSEKISDVSLARLSRNVDIIIGGHTHTFLDAPEIIRNADNQPVLINQVGWGGIMLGRIDLVFEPERSKSRQFYETIPVSPN
ncbi:MAG: bifunctional metallophosphatase/5'-nucleotidase [Saprospiraceae bacterium]